ncbi:MAG: hypothetical protein AABZ30_09615 [Myxococcota bacterium]
MSLVRRAVAPLLVALVAGGALGGLPVARAAPPDAAAALLAMADGIVAQVASARGLAPKRKLQKGVLSRQAISDRLMARIKKEYSPEDIRAEERVLKRLGLLDPAVDYEKAVVDLLMEQVAGFYDPFERKLFIADWLDASLQRPALAHEIGHALCDQHFDLRPYATPLKEEGDRQLARAALVEGDGTAVMLEFTLAEQAADMGLQMVSDIGQLDDRFFASLSGTMGAGSMPAFDRAPRYLRETLVFPYLEGLRFVRYVRKRQPWSAIDAIYQRPPESTEQILHPEKYFARERPVAVRDVPLAPLKGWKRLRGETMGELQTRLWLETQLDAATARRAAQGWGGDRLVAWEPAEGGEIAIVHLSAWDSEADAEEFFRALRRTLAQRVRQPEGEASTRARFVVSGEAFSVEQRGARVLALLGVPEQLLGSIAEDVWRTWKAPKPN